MPADERRASRDLRPLPGVPDRLRPHPGHAPGRGPRGGLRLPPVPPAAPREVPARAPQARARSPAARGGVRAVPLPLQPARRREDRVRARVGSQGVGALPAAALDLVRRVDLRRPEPGERGHAPRLARPQRRDARQPAARLRLHRPDRGRPRRGSRATTSSTTATSRRTSGCGSRAGETMPDFDPAAAPRLDPATWPPERLDTVIARYAMEYVRTTLPVALELLGPADTRALLGHAARLIGMQLHDETARLLAIGAAGRSRSRTTWPRSPGPRARRSRSGTVAAGPRCGCAAGGWRAASSRSTPPPSRRGASCGGVRSRPTTGGSASRPSGSPEVTSRSGSRRRPRPRGDPTVTGRSS